MRKRQFKISIFSILILLCLSFFIWLKVRNYEYEGLEISIFVIMGYWTGVFAGVVIIFIRWYTHTKSKGTLYNFIGIFNIYLNLLTTLFIYYDGGNKISWKLVEPLPGLIIGLFIFKDIYFRKVKSVK
jgi:hypothetical protein